MRLESFTLPSVGPQLSGFPRCLPSDIDLQHTLLRTNLNQIQAAAADVLQKALKSDRQGVLAWLAQHLRIAHRHLAGIDRRDVIADWQSRFCSNGYLMNLVAVILLLFRPLAQKDVKAMLAKVDWRFVCHDWRLPFSSEPTLSGAGGAAEGSVGEAPPGEAQEPVNTVDVPAAEALDTEMGGARGVSDDGNEAEEVEEAEEAEEARLLRQAMELSLAPHADPGFFPADFPEDFSFVTEIFWLTARAMGLVPLLRHRFLEQAEVLHRHLDEARRAATGSAPPPLVLASISMSCASGPGVPAHVLLPSKPNPERSAPRSAP